MTKSILYLATVGILIAVASLVWIPASGAAPLDGSACVIDASGGLLGGAHGVIISGKCVPASDTNDGEKGPPTKTISCGKTSVGTAGWNLACGAPLSCFSIDKTTGKRVQKGAFATSTKVGGAWTKPVVWCPGDTQPAVTMAAMREQAIRLLPHVKIGSAWTTSALVNAETVLWAGTAADRDLGAVTIVGQRVRLRIAFDHADWNFGDAHTDTVTSPGKPYDDANDPCHTAQCRDYYGHTYEHTGTMTITLAVVWNAQFSIDGGTWADIDGAITGPADQHVIAVKQARGVLVPNPGH